MPLELVGQNIQSPVGDSGIYTWADVVALGSTYLTTHTAPSGEIFYRWIGNITLRGTSRLTITAITLELLGTSTTFPGSISTTDSAIVTFGEKTITVTGVVIYENGCTILITRSFYDGNNLEL